MSRQSKYLDEEASELSQIISLQDCYFQTLSRLCVFARKRRHTSTARREHFSTLRHARAQSSSVSKPFHTWSQLCRSYPVTRAKETTGVKTHNFLHNLPPTLSRPVERTSGIFVCLSTRLYCQNSILLVAHE